MCGEEANTGISWILKETLESPYFIKWAFSKDFNIISNNEVYAKIFSGNADRTCI